MRVWRAVKGDAPPPPELFVSAQTLSPSDHLTMQAAAQAFIDSSISKTVNCPEDISFEAFADIYIEGYHLGCKGLTTYRPNAVTGSVLSVGGPKADPVPAKSGRAASAARGAAPRNDLQAQMAGERARRLHHHQRRRAGRHAAPVRDVHQLQEHGALCLDAGAYADGVGGVPAQRRCRVRRRGAEGRVRSARRRLDAGPLRAVAARSDRRHRRAAPAGSRPAASVQARRSDCHRIPFTPPPCPQCGAAKLVKVEGCNNCLDCGYSKCG